MFYCFLCLQGTLVLQPDQMQVSDDSYIRPEHMFVECLFEHTLNFFCLVQTVNPILILTLVPIMDRVVYPLIKKCGFNFT